MAIGKIRNLGVSGDSSPKIEAGTSYEFESEDTFLIPQKGLYKLEVYGASAGQDGGLSVGYKIFEKGTLIYVHVGGGYQKTQHMALLGGEMSSIGKTTWDNSVGLLVAGCSGASSYRDFGGAGWQRVTGGYGGGLSGGQAHYTDESNNNYYKAGATQTSGGSWGGTPSGGAGAGYYCGIKYDDSGNGSGGSGWIAGCPDVTYNGVTYTPQTTGNAATGNGKGVITFIG